MMFFPFLFSGVVPVEVEKLLMAAATLSLQPGPATVGTIHAQHQTQEGVSAPLTLSQSKVRLNEQYISCLVKFSIWYLAL